MYMKLKDGKSKVLTLSYDDGVVQDIRLIGLLDQHGIKATFNIDTGRYLAEDAERSRFYGRLKLSEAQQLYTHSGHEVAVHTLTHPHLNRMTADEVLTEVLEDRKNIARQYGTLARGMAYPFGKYNDEVVECLKLCGICYARTTKSTEDFRFPDNWLTLSATCHHGNPKLMSLAERFVNERPRYADDNWLFYVWGHSYEFDNDDNWDLIENFARYVGGKEDVWYATNIEVYDYVQAYKRLQTSADKSIVHNPSAIDVWFLHDGTTYCVKRGETITL